MVRSQSRELITRFVRSQPAGSQVTRQCWGRVVAGLVSRRGLCPAEVSTDPHSLVSHWFFGKEHKDFTRRTKNPHPRFGSSEKNTKISRGARKTPIRRGFNK